VRNGQALRHAAATIVAPLGLLPSTLTDALVARGLAVEPLDVRPVAAIPGRTGTPWHPRVALLEGSSLPASPVEARAYLDAVRQDAGACIVVGPAPQEIEALLAEVAHAWLGAPLQTPALLTSIRSALELLASRREAEVGRDQIAMKEAEARALYEIGIALSAEKDITRLQERILQRARELTSADAGSLYLIDRDDAKQRVLRFEVAQNDSVESGYQRFTMPLTEESVAGYVALAGRSLNLPDVYDLPADAPYRHNRSFDDRFSYRTKSMLVVPMKNHEGDVIGVIQLINRKRSFPTVLESRATVEREVEAFPPPAEEVVEAFASQAAVALDIRLLLESIEQLFEGFVRASVTAIEARDPTTSGHSERVAELTVGLAQEVGSIAVGRWVDVRFSDAQIREIRYAGLLHDFGKIGVREDVLLKPKKLYDWQAQIVRLRFAFVRKAMEAEHNRRQLAIAIEEGRDAFLEALGPLDAEYRRRITELDEDLATIVAANEPTVIAQGVAARLAEVAERSYQDPDGNDRMLIEPGELLALSVQRGSLTETERREIESHVSHTYRFLSVMPWTRQLRNVPAIAWAHHEKLNGTGYPRGLHSADIPLESRMMAISDIYDALTATDRPYKRAVPWEKALDIIGDEVRRGQLDPELFDVFVQRRVFEVTTPGARAISV
jgi:HD-GYP domain-containing protein (c-di-GMP phosphodiesterase class II)